VRETGIVAHMTDRYDVINFLPREMANRDPGAVFAVGRYGAALYRQRPADCGEIGYPDGIWPARPLRYDDLEPFCTRAEWLCQVHGDHGGDPTEGKASKQYPWPPARRSPR
jgi:hypothetical protein